MLFTGGGQVIGFSSTPTCEKNSNSTLWEEEHGKPKKVHALNSEATSAGMIDTEACLSWWASRQEEPSQQQERT